MNWLYKAFIYHAKDFLQLIPGFIILALLHIFGVLNALTFVVSLVLTVWCANWIEKKLPPGGQDATTH